MSDEPVFPRLAEFVIPTREERAIHRATYRFWRNRQIQMSEALNRNLFDRETPNMFRPITIKAALNGFIVDVGCQTLVFNSHDTMVAELQRYLAKPAETEHDYLTRAINAHLYNQADQAVTSAPGDDTPGIRRRALREEAEMARTRRLVAEVEEKAKLDGTRGLRPAGLIYSDAASEMGHVGGGTSTDGMPTRTDPLVGAGQVMHEAIGRR